MLNTIKKIRLILGDQLNIKHAWLEEKNQSDTLYVLMEIRSETDYAWHHVQKICGIFAAMREFNNFLLNQGFKTHYLQINDPLNKQNFTENLKLLIQLHNIETLEYQMPDEYRLDLEFKRFQETLNLPVTVFDTDHFYTKRMDLSDFFEGKKSYLLESFYRDLRKKHHILIENSTGKPEPLGGQWNFDHDNRKKLPKNHLPTKAFVYNNDVTEIKKNIDESGVGYFGDIDPKNFLWPINKTQSLALLNHFLIECLPFFGTYEDAMTNNSWSIYHSRLSFAMNIKMISPKEVIDAAIAYFMQNRTEISINQIEGFVRQILGWREYMRGIYWAKMPEFANLNFFNHEAKLPEWFWTGKTKMNCLKQSIQQTINYAYAHHIQRLMVTGNFALLAGISPDELDHWYLSVYIDAFDWVEITNTRGMSQFADGGIVGTKPYVASANYIDKMSDYCGTCFYNKKERTTDASCPFNSLYWDFYLRHEQKLGKNPRIGMAYQLLNKMTPIEKEAIITRAQFVKENIENL